MKKVLKMMSIFAVAFCILSFDAKAADTFSIDVINGQDGTGTNYGTITTTKNSCTVTESDSSTSQLITIESGTQLYVNVDAGCTQTFTITVNEGYEIESVLLDRKSVEISADGTYTFENITENHALCVKYKKVGTPSSPNTGVASVLPLAAVALVSFGMMIVVVRKRHNVQS